MSKMEDFYESESDFYKDEPKFEGVNWNGLILAPLLQFLILLLPHISNFIKERQLLRHLVATKGRKEELLQLKKELSKISMTDEFARHAKLQRRINAIQDLLTAETTEATNKATADKNKFHSACYGSLIVSHLLTIMYHRSTPLFVLPVQWFAFGPINWIISFPTGVDGAVGFTFWLITCRRILNSVYHGLFPAPEKPDSADPTVLSNLMNSMMGMKSGATGDGLPAIGRAGSPTEAMENMIVPALD